MSTVASQSEKPTEFVGFFAPAALRDRLVETARQNERTVSAEMRLALRQHLESEKEDE